MPEANIVRQPGLKAAANLSAAANQFRGVKITAANSVNLCTVAGEQCFGVLYNKPLSGGRAEVVVDGSPKMKAGGVIAVNDLVQVDTDGDFIKTTPAVGNTDHAVAIAITAAAADGDIFQGKLLGGATVNQSVS